jgi:hypothetical protein
MAFHLEKRRTASTPYVLVDEEKNYMRMEGRSFHENIAEFFKEINDWLDGYLASDFGVFTFDCEMNYFNSSTVKALLNMILRMDKRSFGGNKVIINWITTSDNEIIIECGEDFKEDVSNLEFNLVIKP